IVFGAERYAPGTPYGRQLLVHELTHVAQQHKGGSGHDAEPNAKTITERVTQGQSVEPNVISGAGYGLYTDKDDESEAQKRPESETLPPLHLSWDELGRPGKS